MASNCGQCPHTTTNNVVTCSGNYVYTQLLHDRQCSFAVQAVVCDDIVGDKINAVLVPRVLDIPNAGSEMQPYLVPSPFPGL